MAVLMSAYNSEGCIGRCDAKCYDATGSDCDCICGGRNHAVGARKAYDNTKKYVEIMTMEYKERAGEPVVVLDETYNFTTES